MLIFVLTFTATAQVTHTIVVSTTPTVNITANVGDVLHFTTVNMFTSLTMLRSTAPANISGIAGTTSFNYTILSTDTAYYVSDNSNSVYGKITVVTSTLTTGIESLKHTSTKLSVFPNPSTDEVNVTFNWWS